MEEIKRLQNKEIENNKNTDEENESQIKEMASVEVGGKKGKIHCLSIIGEIEGHTILPPQSKTTKYEHVIPHLLKVEEDEEIDGLLILLNTVGGDVEAGLAIAEMIASMKKPTVSIVLGGGHSIGVPLAVSSQYSMIVPSATMTIHPIRTTGMVIGVPQSFQYFNKVQERLISFVVKNSNIKEKKLKDLMMETAKIPNDMGTILFGEEAVQCGLIDKVGGISDAIDKTYKMARNKKRQKK